MRRLLRCHRPCIGSWLDCMPRVRRACCSGIIVRFASVRARAAARLLALAARAAPRTVHWCGDAASHQCRKSRGCMCYHPSFSLFVSKKHALLCSEHLSLLALQAACSDVCMRLWCVPSWCVLVLLQCMRHTQGVAAGKRGAVCVTFRFRHVLRPYMFAVPVGAVQHITGCCCVVAQAASHTHSMSRVIAAPHVAAAAQCVKRSQCLRLGP